ncbi:MAG: phage portal protein [Acidimicrobiia bacterium]|nr:phage portal protein [Acidimicrobiia bacterium]
MKFGEFEQTDLGGYISAIEQDVLHIAVTSRTPRHYLIEQGQSPSGDAIRSAEAGLVAKVRRKMRPFGECFEEVLRLARRFDGLGEPPPDSEIIWADPQTRTEAETTDAVIKKFQAGLIPWRTAVEDLGYTQTEIARMAGMRTLDQVLQPTPSLAGEEDAVA